MSWLGICRRDDLTPGRAVCALLDGRQVAVVLHEDGELFAVGNHDPFSGAYVLSRGIVGSRTVDGDVVPTLQSPMYKQAFDLRTGVCLDDASVSVPVYDIRARGEVVELAYRRA